jgi:hypothetical protein
MQRRSPDQPRRMHFIGYRSRRFHIIALRAPVFASALFNWGIPAS